MNSKVLIKHSPSGINVVLDKHISFEELTAETASHFKEAARFFGKCSLTVTFTGRIITSEQEDILCQAIEDNSEITILCVFVEDKVRDSVYVRARKIVEDQAMLRATLAVAPKRQHRVSEFLTYPGSIPEGEVCRTTHNILVLGDLPAGAVLASEQNIIVLGNLLGTAMAGDKTGSRGHESLGDLTDLAAKEPEAGSHVVLAAHMQPAGLVIDGLAWQPVPVEPVEAPRRGGLFGRRSKDRDKEPAVIPSGIAYVSDGAVLTEEISAESLQNVLTAAGLNLTQTNL